MRFQQEHRRVDELEDERERESKKPRGEKGRTGKENVIKTKIRRVLLKASPDGIYGWSFLSTAEFYSVARRMLTFEHRFFEENIVNLCMISYKDSPRLRKKAAEYSILTRFRSL